MTKNTRWAARPQRTDLLTAPVSAYELKEFRKTHPSKVPWALLIFSLVAVLAIALVFTPMSHDSGISAMPIFFVLLGGLLTVGIVISFLASRAKLRNQYRRTNFAMANSMMYEPVSKFAHRGMIFHQGSGRIGLDVLKTGGHERPVEFGNWQYTTGSGKSQQTHRWGYMMVTLANPLPHIVLDAEGNNGFFGSNLPVTFDKQQRLDLEGNFNQFFRLYCPVGYERDALYLFTPDVMARFIDTASELDVEIIDDKVFFYSRRNLSTLDSATWHWLYSVIDAFLTRVDQWERWRDDRLSAQQSAPGASDPYAAGAGSPVGSYPGNPLAPHDSEWMRPPNSFLGQKGVGLEGQRLKKGVNWILILALIGTIALGILSNLSRLL